MEAYDRRATDRTWRVIDAVQEIAEDRGVSMAEVAIAWVTARPGVSSTILGARTTIQLEANLRAAGLATLGELAAAPAERLRSIFGPRLGEELRRRARFQDDSPVTQERKVVSESRETTFDADLATLAELEPVLGTLVAQLCDGLQRQHRCGRTIGIKVRLDDFSTHTRARTLAEPVGSADRVGPVALELLRQFAPPRPVRLLGVRVAGLQFTGDAVGAQLTLAL